MRSRTRAEWSLLVFAGYLLVIGAVLSVAPNALLGLFGVAPTDEPFVHVVGGISMVLAYYYARIVAARFEPFYLWTVHTRVFVLGFFLVAVATEVAPPILLLFGLVEFACAMWTWLAIRSDRASEPAAPPEGQ
jgi:hypothetical protein